MLKSFDSLDSLVNSGDNVLMDLLKYSFVLRYLSNNQIIVYGSLMSAKYPLNFHLSSQAFSNGLKPGNEKYSQQEVPRVDNFQGIFGTRISSEAITFRESGIRRLSLNGFTNNIFINDPTFSMILLILLPLILILTIILIVRRRSQSESQFQNSVPFKLSILVGSSIPDFIEASLLTILLTNYTYFESFELRTSYDIGGFLFLSLIDGLAIAIQVLQFKFINKILMLKDEIGFIYEVFEYILWDQDYENLVTAS